MKVTTKLSSVTLAKRSKSKTSQSVTVHEKQAKETRPRAGSKSLTKEKNESSKGSSLSSLQPLRRSSRISSRREAHREKPQVTTEFGISLNSLAKSRKTKSTTTGKTGQDEWNSPDVSRNSSKIENKLEYQTVSASEGVKNAKEPKNRRTKSPKIVTNTKNEKLKKNISKQPTKATALPIKNRSSRSGPATINETFKCPAPISVKNRGKISNRRLSISISKVLPVLRERATPTREDLSGVHSVKKSLHVSAVPQTLPCREKEFKDISTIIENKILDSSGG